MEQERETSSLRDFLTVLFKHKSKILLIFLFTVITVSAGTFLIASVYEAKSSLLVKFGREYIYRPEVGDTKSTVSFQSFNQEEAIRSEIQILTSNDLIEKVINTLGVHNLYPDMIKNPTRKMKPLEAAILKFEKKISVENIRKSNVIEVSFQHKDPGIAARAVNQLVESYKEKHIQVLSNSKSSFIEKQLTTYQQKLKESENNLEAFKQKHNIFSLDEQRSLLLKQRLDMDTSLKTVQNRTHELKQILSSPDGEIPMAFKNAPFYTETERYKVIDNAKSKLLTLQLREQELLGKFRQDSRTVTNIRKEIHLVKEFLKEQETKLAEAELGSLEAKAAATKQQLKLLDRELMTLDQRAKELRVLKREVTTNEKNYKIYLNKLEEARISEDMDRHKIANISVIQKAFIPAKPIRPRVVLNIVLGVILGALSGLGFAFFSEYLSLGVSTPESLERHLALPVLATFSFSCNKEKAKLPILRWGLNTSATFFLIGSILWISPYKNTILSRVDNPVVSQAVNNKPVISEVQKEVPSLEVKTFSERSNAPVSPGQEAFLPTESISSPWVINIASFSSKRYAINLLDKIKKDGFNVYITKFKQKDKLWYRVRIGFFPTREYASIVGKDLSERYVLQGLWIANVSRYEALKYKEIE
jgi:uncharacterized protein involved in exopolysaccharide biosynthesis